MLPDIAGRCTKGRELAGICATGRSQRRHRYSRQVVSAHFSLAPKSRFPETETARGRDSVRMPVTPKEVRASGAAEATRRACRRGGPLPCHEAAAPRCRFHEIGRQEGKRDRHVDLANAAPLALGDAFRLFVRVGQKFVEPTAPSRNRCDQERAGLRAYRTSVLRWKPRGQKNLPASR